MRASRLLWCVALLALFLCLAGEVSAEPFDDGGQPFALPVALPISFADIISYSGTTMPSANPTVPTATPPPATPQPATSRPPIVVAPPRGARVVRALSDFKSVDDSLVFPRGAAPEIKNITQDADGTFRFVLRHRGNPWSKVNPKGTRGAWYDGDRDLEWNEGKRDGKYHDKSRAEVSGAFDLTQRYGETWEYATTFKVDNDFVPSVGYCNLMQPVLHVCWLGLDSIRGDTISASLDYTKAVRGFAPSATARSFTFKRGEWVSIVVRIKIHDSQGTLEASINGDDFRGVRNVKMNNQDAKGAYVCKWGIYGSGTTNVNRQPLGDWTVMHKNVWLRKA